MPQRQQTLSAQDCNPCCDGRYLQSIEINSVYLHAVILVIMEYTYTTINKDGLRDIVVILVIMEVSYSGAKLMEHTYML